MAELKTAEHIIHFMRSGSIKLSRYDGRFIDNLAVLKEVTTNQVALFNKLIHKYRRQFSKHEMFVEKLVELPWTMKIVESAPYHTNGYIFIENDVILFRCPFNRNFINKFRNNTSNYFVWNKERKVYQATFGPHNLRVVMTLTKEFFPNLTYCDNVKELLDPLKEYSEFKYWNPTLVKANNRYYIAGINEYLNEALGDIELNTEPATLAKLCLHGVDVDIEELHTNPKLLFAAEFNPVVERNELENIIPWLNELGCDIVLLYGNVSSAHDSGISKLFSKYGIKTQDANVFRTMQREAVQNYKFAVSLRARSTDSRDYDNIISKAIRIVNSEPINIK
jgi:hypothetical protein